MEATVFESNKLPVTDLEIGRWECGSRRYAWPSRGH